MTGLPVFLRPSVKFQEIDLTQRVSVILSTIFSVVGEFERGPLEPTYLDGVTENFAKRYGRMANVAKYGFAHDTVMAAMTQSSNGLIKRVVSDARYAGSSVIKDRANNRWIFDEYELGTNDGYADSGLSPVIIVRFDDDLITGNTFTLDVTDGATIVASNTVTYATSHNNTMNNIAASILAAMNTFGSGNSVTVYKETSSSNANNHILIIRPSRSLALSFINPVVAAGASQTDVEIEEDASLFDILAENPGDWANDYGYRITNIDPGVRERFRLTFAGPLIASNSFNMSINGEAIGPVVYTTNSDATMEAIADAIASDDMVADAYVETQPGPLNNDRSIVIIAQKPGPNQLQITNPIVTGGGSQPVAVVSRTLTGVAPDNTFTIEVFNKADLTRAEETFRVSLTNQIATLGGQQNIKQVVNLSSSRSRNIRIQQNTVSEIESIYDPDTGNIPTVSNAVFYLNGGDDGTKPNSAHIRQGWQSLNDRVTYPFSVMLNAGYTQNSVQKEMTDIAEKRSDCIAILDAPADKQGAQQLREYRLNELDIDSSYAAMYTPDVLVEDIHTGERRYIPPSGPIAATYAYSDRLTNFMGAPAGLNRGKVNMALGLRHVYTPAEEELLFPIGINCIIDKRGTGPVVMGEETLQFKKSVLSSVHARRILNIIKTGLVDGLEYTLFDPNTEYTRNQALQIGETILKPILRGGGLYDYRQICDERNNTPDVIDNDALDYDVYLKIVRVVKGIMVRGILTRTGANFDEIIDEMSGGSI